MGFEQLASLRDELAKQAAAEKSVIRQKKVEASVKKGGKVDALLAIIGLLQKTFPLAFPKKPAPKVPLKIGIHKDILEQAERLGTDKNDLRKAIKAWCWGNRYWDCLTEDAVRVDLDGNAAGQVTKADTEQAKKLKAGRRKQSETVTALPAEGD
ncbi:ProQ/FinO family protein [Methylomonas montana]|uniref:ProQ/FinO family protein n=1 Tax=Methylomonas montana TaxID=3058963 RepID=UPI002657D3E8|nr:ProQ/FinO family protein [Methylomonas montana]WKJ92383.1 ProQ/FinO family protein [Methylomonas montana]